jgi:AcrR family transcriptional regulator
MSTREDLIRAAEVLFARQGFEATSLRQITEAADANIASVNYHFGSKQGLLIEVLDSVIDPIIQDRHRMLDELEREGDPDVRSILTAFLLPDLRTIADLRKRDPDLPRFLARMYTEGTELMNEVTDRQFGEDQARFVAAFEPALPALTQDEILWRLRCVVGIVIYLFAGADPPMLGPILSGDVDEDLDRLLNVTIPLMTAETR